MNLNSYILLVVVTSAFASDLAAQSLFENRHPQQLGQFSNVVARSRGDLLVVLINENTDVENIDLRTLERSGTSTLAAGANFSATGDFGSGVGSVNIGQTGNQTREFNGDSEFRSERQLLDRFSVTVVDVLPNGNLLVEGKRRVFLQGDTRTLLLTGTVRTVDLLPNNTVSSQLVANLDIRLLAEGPEYEFGKQGWLGRRLNKWLPF